jgi:hypothetical protein
LKLQEIFFNQPLHPSYIADTEILDEEEFGESSASRTQDDELSAAEQLGLMVCINADSTHFHFWL